MGVILITLFSLAVVGGIGYLAAELGVAEQEIERLRKESSYSKELVALYEQEEREFKELIERYRKGLQDSVEENIRLNKILNEKIKILEINRGARK